MIEAHILSESPMAMLLRTKGKSKIWELSKSFRMAYDILEKKAVMEQFREEQSEDGIPGSMVSMADFFTDYFYRRYGSQKQAKKQVFHINARTHTRPSLHTHTENLPPPPPHPPPLIHAYR